MKILLQTRTARRVLGGIVVLHSEEVRGQEAVPRVLGEDSRSDGVILRPVLNEPRTAKYVGWKMSARGCRRVRGSEAKRLLNLVEIKLGPISGVPVEGTMYVRPDTQWKLIQGRRDKEPEGSVVCQ